MNHDQIHRHPPYRHKGEKIVTKNNCLSETLDAEIKNSEVIVKINPFDLWMSLSHAEKEEILNEEAAWGLVRDELSYLLGECLATETFYSDLHRLRSLLLQDETIVSGMIVQWAKGIAQSLADAKQRASEAEYEARTYARMLINELDAQGRRDEMPRKNWSEHIRRFTDDEIKEQVLSIINPEKEMQS